MTSLSHRSQTAAAQRGASIVELALILGITGVIAIGAFSAMSTARKSQNENVENVALVSARNALQTFVLTEKRLPCPDMSGSGFEGSGSPNSCAMAGNVGRFPFRTLNMEKPILADGKILRYGVWRETLTDLAVRPPMPPTPTGPDLDADGRHRFLTRIVDATKLYGGLTQPYIAATDALGRATNCNSVASNPAAVVAISERDNNSVCFFDAPTGESQTVYISRLEFLGWLHQYFR